MNISNTIHIRDLLTQYAVAGDRASFSISLKLSDLDDYDDDTNFHIYCTLPEKVKPSHIECKQSPAIIKNDWDGKVNNAEEFNKSLSKGRDSLTKEELEKWNDATHYGKLMMASWVHKNISPGPELKELTLAVDLLLPTDELIDYSKSGDLKLEVYLISETEGEFTTENRSFSLNVVPTPPAIKAVRRKSYASLSALGPLDLSALEGSPLELELELKQKYLSETMLAELVNNTNSHVFTTKIKKKSSAAGTSSSIYTLNIDKAENWLENNSQNIINLKLTPTADSHDIGNRSTTQTIISEKNDIFNTVPLQIKQSIVANLGSVEGKLPLSVKIESREVIESEALFINKKKLIISYDDGKQWHPMSKVIHNPKAFNLKENPTDLSGNVRVSFCDEDDKPVFTQKKLVELNISKLLYGKVLYTDKINKTLFEPTMSLARSINVDIISPIKLPEFSITAAIPTELRVVDNRTVCQVGDKKTFMSVLGNNKFDAKVCDGMQGFSVLTEAYANSDYLCRPVSNFTFTITGHNVTGELPIESLSETTLKPHIAFVNLPKSGSKTAQPIFNKYSFSESIKPSLLEMAMTDISGFYSDVFKDYSLYIRVEVTSPDNHQNKVLEKSITELSDGRFLLPDLSSCFNINGQYSLSVTSYFYSKKVNNKIKSGHLTNIISSIFTIDNSQPSITVHPLISVPEGLKCNATVVADTQTYISSADIFWTDSITTNVTVPPQQHQTKLSDSIKYTSLTGIFNPQLRVRASNNTERNASLYLNSFSNVIACNLTVLNKDKKNDNKSIPADAINDETVANDIKESEVAGADNIVTLKLKISHVAKFIKFNSLAVTLTPSAYGSIKIHNLESKNKKYVAVKNIDDTSNDLTLFTGNHTSDDDELIIEFVKQWKPLQANERMTFTLSLSEDSDLKKLNRQHPVVTNPSIIRFALVC